MCVEQLQHDERSKVNPSSRFLATILGPEDQELVLWLESKDYKSALEEALMESNWTNCGCLLKNLLDQTNNLTIHLFPPHLSALPVVVIWKPDVNHPNLGDDNFFLDGHWAYDPQIYYANQLPREMEQPIPLFSNIEPAIKFLERSKAHTPCQLTLSEFQSRWSNRTLKPANLEVCDGCHRQDGEFSAFVVNKRYCQNCAVQGAWYN